MFYMDYKNKRDFVKENKLINSIFFKCLKLYALNTSSPIHNSVSKKIGNYEGFKIFITPITLKLIINNFFFPLRDLMKNLDKNICFLKTTYDPTLVLGCDWCSLVNGIIKTAIDNLKDNLLLIENIDFIKLDKSIKYLEFCIKDRKEEFKIEDINNKCLSFFGLVNEKLFILTYLYILLERIELSYCPFKRSCELYYRNLDERYFPYNKENMIEIGKILLDYERIECSNCPKIINKNSEKKDDSVVSILQPLKEYLIENSK